MHTCVTDPRSALIRAIAGHKGNKVWPFLPLTLALNYGLFKGDLIRLCFLWDLVS